LEGLDGLECLDGLERFRKV